MSTGQVSASQTSLASGTSQATEMVRSLDLQVFTLLEGSLSMEEIYDKVIVGSLKNIRLNLDALHNEYLHTLQAGVTTKFRARE